MLLIYSRNVLLGRTTSIRILRKNVFSIELFLIYAREEETELRPIYIPYLRSQSIK